MRKLTLEMINKKVDDIYCARADSETAHSLEDKLHECFIKHIAKTGTNEQRKMAKAILKAEDMDFARWTA